MEITITLPEEVERALGRRAAASGQDVKAFVEEMVKEQALRLTLDEILKPVREEFAESGMTEEELDELIKAERRAMWEEKQGERS